MTSPQPPPVGSPVTIQYLKYPNTLHWRHEALWLGRDEFGTWLGAPAGSTVQRGLEPPISWPTPYVQLIPDTAWFTLIGNPPEAANLLYVDVVTAPRWVGPDRVEMTDIDLDIVRDRHGGVRLVDEDEFEEHQRTLNYPPRLIARARATAAELMLAVERAKEPFGTMHFEWLTRLSELE